VRQSVFAYYFGNSDAADVWTAGFRIPNLLQNLFGEGALSASFIPVYARLRAHGRGAEARRVAGAVAGLLTFTLAVLVLTGVLATPALIGLVAPGFTGEKREAAIRVVQIFFPGAGLLVMSAWCLGVLNSHRKFFLSYAAPVIWSAAIVAAMLLFGGRESGYRLGELVAWGSVVGSALQLLIQLPFVLRLLATLHDGEGGGKEFTAEVREVFRNFGPAAAARGVVQISAYIDTLIASFLPGGAVATLGYAQLIYTLPVSLFGMSVSAAELPAMSEATGSADEIGAHLRRRLDSGMRRIAFFTVPAVAAFLAIGDLLSAILFERGAFTREGSLWVWATLAGSAVGLLATTLARLCSSGFYALRDTRTPALFAAARVTIGAGLGSCAALLAPGLLGIAPHWGTAFLTAASGCAGWIEFGLLRRALSKRIGAFGLPSSYLLKLWGSALVAAAGATAVRFAGPVVLGAMPHARLITAMTAAVLFAALYLPVARRLAGWPGTPA